MLSSAVAASPFKITNSTVLSSTKSTTGVLKSDGLVSSLRRSAIVGRKCASNERNGRRERVLLSSAALKSEGELIKGITPSEDVKKAAQLAVSSCVTSTSLPILKEKNFKRYEGKVRDTYVNDDILIAVTTDRQSAFDRHLANIPF